MALGCRSFAVLARMRKAAAVFSWWRASRRGGGGGSGGRTAPPAAGSGIGQPVGAPLDLIPAVRPRSEACPAASTEPHNGDGSRLRLQPGRPRHRLLSTASGDIDRVFSTFNVAAPGSLVRFAVRHRYLSPVPRMTVEVRAPAEDVGRCGQAKGADGRVQQSRKWWVLPLQPEPEGIVFPDSVHNAVFRHRPRRRNPAGGEVGQPFPQMREDGRVGTQVPTHVVLQNPGRMRRCENGRALASEQRCRACDQRTGTTPRSVEGELPSVVAGSVDIQDEVCLLC